MKLLELMIRMFWKEIVLSSGMQILIVICRGQDWDVVSLGPPQGMKLKDNVRQIPWAEHLGLMQ